jgi:hypothetical protein
MTNNDMWDPLRSSWYHEKLQEFYLFSRSGIFPLLVLLSISRSRAHSTALGALVPSILQMFSLSKYLFIFKFVSFRLSMK